MIYAVTKMGINGGMARGMKESTTPKGVDSVVDVIKTG